MISIELNQTYMQKNFLSTLFLPQERVQLFVIFMGLASGAIRVQLFLAVQNRSFCCLILQIGVSYLIIMYYLNYEHTGL